MLCLFVLLSVSAQMHSYSFCFIQIDRVLWKEKWVASIVKERQPNTRSTVWQAAALIRVTLSNHCPLCVTEWQSGFISYCEYLCTPHAPDLMLYREMSGSNREQQRAQKGGSVSALWNMLYANNLRQNSTVWCETRFKEDKCTI